VSSKTRLPDNWKPCEVNQAPDLNQYLINAFASSVYDSLYDSSYNEKQWVEQDSVKLALYKNPKLLRYVQKVEVHMNYLPSNFKNFIDAN